MKKVESIWAELSAKQVELSEEKKVELAKIDDLRKQLDEHMSKGQKFQSDLSSMASEMSRRAQSLESISKEAEDLVQKAKELGIEDSSYSFVSTEAKGYAQTMSSFAKLIARNMGSL